MSLDVYLYRDRPASRADEAIALLAKHGFDEFVLDIQCHHETGPEQVFWANYTHNLGKMADAARIYEPLWRPDEIGISKAAELAPLLREGIRRLEADPEGMKRHNPENGWGDYDGFLNFVRQYLSACEDFPDARVEVSR